MTTLKLVTPGPPAAQPIGGRHLYSCRCQPCTIERHGRTPAVCTCDKPTIYADPTANGEPCCLRCGRPPAALAQVA